MKLIFILLLILLPSTMLAERKWVQKHYVQYEDFRTMQYLDSNNVFAFVDGVGFTIIYKSTDQGDTWYKHYEHKHIGVGDSLYKVFRCHALDTMNIYMTYLDRVALEKSSDGGETFERITFGDLSTTRWNYFNCFRMFDNNIGAGCINDDLIITKDNWHTYKKIELGENSRTGGPLFFIDSNNIALLEWYRNDHKFVKYDIINNEWSPYNKGEEPKEGERNKEISEVFFVNDTIGYACGGQNTGEGEIRKDIIWKTIDKGKHWSIVLDTEFDPPFGLSKLSFKNELHGIVVGNYGKIVETTNGGKTWTYLEVPEEIIGTIGQNVTWAGRYPIIGSQKAGIHRLEGELNIDEEILKNNDVIIQRSEDKLLISIEDKAFRKYTLQIVDINGRMVQEEELNSGIGTLFIPVQLNDYNSGSYFYGLSTNGKIVKTGKFVIAK